MIKNRGVYFLSKDLCTRCGSCIGVCAKGALERNIDAYPEIDEAACRECGLCEKVCPGYGISYYKMYRQTFGVSGMGVDYLGHFKAAFVAASTNEKVRSESSSGGLVTELLLFLLDCKRIDGAIVTKMDETNPSRTKTFIARTAREVLQARQSKYTISSTNIALSEVMKNPGRYAYVGLPCQIQGLRQWTHFNKKISQRIKYVIGLFCLTSLETNTIDELCRVNQLNLSQLKDFQFREGLWPGNIYAVMRGYSKQKLHYSNFKDGAINYLTKMYPPKRCQLCTDGTAEFADIAVADSWMLNQYGKFAYPATTMVMARSIHGQKLIQEANQHNRIHLTKIYHDDLYHTYSTLEKNKKIFSVLRIDRLKKQKKPFPKFRAEFPRPGKKIKLVEKLSTSLLAVSRNKMIRLSLLTIFLSSIGKPLIYLRKKRKRRSALSSIKNRFKK